MSFLCAGVSASARFLFSLPFKHKIVFAEVEIVISTPVTLSAHAVD
jgi:hypothetical protein